MDKNNFDSTRKESPTSHMEMTRVIALEGAANCRDLGGLTNSEGKITKSGVFFRSDGLSRLTDRDLSTLQGLGIRSVIDLRDQGERARAPSRYPNDKSSETILCGFTPKAAVSLFDAVNRGETTPSEASAVMQANYAGMPFSYAAEISKVFHYLISDNSSPLLIHCMSGKDRTGVVVALVLLAIGVNLSEIMTDYQMSNVNHQPVDVFTEGARQDTVATLMAAHPDYIQSTISAIETRCRSVQDYFSENLQFGQNKIERLKSLLLE